MRKILSIAMVLLLLLSTFIALAPTAIATNLDSTEIEKLTNNTEDDFGPSLYVDALGNPHIAWFRDHAGTFEIFYGVKQDSYWNISKVTSLASWKSPPGLSLALDGSGKPHIAVVTETNRWDLWYLWWDETTSAWMIEPVTNGGTHSHKQGPSIAIDSTGAPHIAWAARWGGGLWGVFYATKNGGLWTIETVSHSDDSAAGLALDPNDAPHVLYYHDAYWDPLGRKVRYASRIAGSWTSEDIYDVSEAAGGGTGGHRNLFIDPSGVPHIVFFVQKTVNRFELWYGNKSDGTWSFSQIGESSYPNPSRIFLNSEGVPYVAWQSDDAGNWDIYLSKMEDDNWQVTQVTEDVIDEISPSLFIDSADNVHLAWSGPLISDGLAEIYHKRISVPPVPATIDIDPNTLNLASNGEWVTAYIELPEGYSVDAIDVSTILLNGSISVDLEAPTEVEDYDVDGIPDLMVKFDRAAVIEWLGTVDHSEDTGKSDEVIFVIAGEVAGTPFEGIDMVRVLSKD